MGETSSIEWTDATWNPWSGCSKVSPGCKNCYAERIIGRRRDFYTVKKSTASFNAPLRWKNPKMIFTCSISDFFHESADAWRDEAWDIIDKTPRHTYQILTKRPERIRNHLPGNWPYPNVWLGTSVETDLYMSRVYALLRIPAVVHFLSAEPLLGPLTLSRTIMVHEGGSVFERRRLDWVITGGESDPTAPRLAPELPDWFRAIRDTCAAYGVDYFHKQNGGTSRCACHGAWGCRLLDGKLHDAMPT